MLGDSARGAAYAVARLVVEGDRILEADASGMARPLAGLTLLEAAAVPGEALAADAVADALGRVFRAAPDPGRVAVAMSGGVDSAVALLRAAPNAVGVTLRLWVDPDGPRVERACCSPEAVLAARRLCHALGVPHVTLDLRDAFRREVVAPFVSSYAEGLTPNPCSRCNAAFRFHALLDFATRAGAAVLWTGHYARVVERDGRRLVARGIDPRKDQSYMLAALDPSLLDRIAFPLGTQTKEQTRAEAAAAGLAAAARAESQEACFLGGGDYRAFLERHGVRPRRGAIVDEAGRTLGEHDGAWRFTPGQRRGIRVPAAEPLYALRTETKTNTLVVGPRASLARRRIEAKGRLYLPVERAGVQLRHRSGALAGSVERTPGGFAVELDEAAYGVAPGQIAALYDDDAVVGAGVITAASG